MKVKNYNLMLISNILFCALSLFLYVSSPVNYSLFFNILVLCVFLSLNFIFFSFNRSFKVGVGFEILFFIGFMMGNLAYPIFYYPNNPNISLFQFQFNPLVINKSSGLALVAYSFYVLFASDYTSKLSVYRNNFNISNNVFLINFIISIFLLIIFIATGGFSRLSNVYTGDVDLSVVSSASYAGILFEIVTMLLACLVFIIKSIKIRFFAILYLLLVVLAFLSTGSRGFSISVLLILLVSYSLLIKKINILTFLILIAVGSSLMYFLMIFRELGVGDSSNASEALNVIKKSSNIFDPFMDIIINNRNLYVLVDFVDSFDSVNFLNVVTSLFSVIPGIGYIINFFQIPDYLIAGKLPTYLEFGNNAEFGLGTNMVGEAYLSFGLFGVILVFSLFGALIRFLRFNSNIYLFIFYLMLIGQVLFIVRSDYLYPMRKILWAMILFMIITKFANTIFGKVGRRFSK